MKPTHIVYNPEGKPDGLYVIDMPHIKDFSSAVYGGFVQEAFEKAVQSAIASAKIKVDNADVPKIEEAILSDHENHIFILKQGKVYELSDIELEVYEGYNHTEECRIECHCNTDDIIQLARIKTAPEKYYSVLSEFVDLESEQEKKEKLVEPKENQDEAWEEIRHKLWQLENDRAEIFQQSFSQLKSKFLITRK